MKRCVLVCLVLASCASEPERAEPVATEKALGFADGRVGEAVPCPMSAPAPGADSEKQSSIYAIADKLSLAWGDSRLSPTLNVVVGHDTPPSFVPAQNEIRFETGVYDICDAAVESRDDCVAFVLSHELAHFYRDHAKLAESGSVHVSKEYESQADVLGGFYSQLAGYRALEAAPKSLEAIYGCYGIGPTIPGYRSLADRQAEMVESQKEVAQAALAFEASTYLMMLRRFDLSAVVFDALGQKFPSREILNNSALSRLMIARALQKDEAYVYPLQSDLRSELGTEDRPVFFGKNRKGKGWDGGVRKGKGGGVRKGKGGSDGEESKHGGLKTIAAETFRRPNERGDDGDAKLSSRLIREATTRLRDLLVREPAYLAAEVNLASATVMDADPAEGGRAVERLRRVAREKGDELSLADAKILEAIVANKQGDTVRAATLLASVGPLRAHVVELNQSATSGAVRPPPSYGGSSLSREQVGGFHPRAAPTDGPETSTIVSPLLDGRALVFTKKVEPTWFSLRADVDGKQVVGFLSTRPGYEGHTAAGAKLGDKLEAIQQIPDYSAPTRILPTSSGHRILVFAEHYEPGIGPIHGLLMIINPKGELESWMAFVSAEV